MNHRAAAAIVRAVVSVWGVGSLLTVVYGSLAKRSIDRSNEHRRRWRHRGDGDRPRWPQAGVRPARLPALTFAAAAYPEFGPHGRSAREVEHFRDVSGDSRARDSRSELTGGVTMDERRSPSNAITAGLPRFLGLASATGITVAQSNRWNPPPAQEPNESPDKPSSVTVPADFAARRSRRGSSALQGLGQDHAGPGEGRRPCRRPRKRHQGGAGERVRQPRLQGRGSSVPEQDADRSQDRSGAPGCCGRKPKLPTPNQVTTKLETNKSIEAPEKPPTRTRQRKLPRKPRRDGARADKASGGTRGARRLKPDDGIWLRTRKTSAPQDR